MSQAAWETFLERFSSKDLMPEAEIIKATAKEHCPEVLARLADAQIQSLPVWDEEKADYIGLVDVMDFVATVCMMNNAKEFIEALAHREITWKEFFEREQTVFADQEIGEMCNASGRNPWCPVHESLPLHSVMDVFGKDVNVHRVPVVNDDGKVVGLIAQSKIIAFLRRELGAYEEVSQRKVSDVWDKTREPVCVNANDPTFKAFQTIINQNVNGACVVDDEGVLVGALSASDIKGSMQNAMLFSGLRLPVREYLAAAHNESLKPVSCTTSSTILSVLEQLDDHHIHRVFVVDEQSKPIGVLSLCDVITFLSLHFQASASC